LNFGVSTSSTLPLNSAPHFIQNFAFGDNNALHFWHRNSEEHFGQTFAEAEMVAPQNGQRGAFSTPASMGTPHFLQKIASLGKTALQLLQTFAEGGTG
jgi:hypothetical protein